LYPSKAGFPPVFTEILVEKPSAGEPFLPQHKQISFCDLYKDFDHFDQASSKDKLKMLTDYVDVEEIIPCISYWHKEKNQFLLITAGQGEAQKYTKIDRKETLAQNFRSKKECGVCC
jgi:hypothetical protein